VTRGPLVESVHSAAVAVADSSGKIVARLGGIDHPIFIRSSAKPFQTMAVIESGAAGRFAFSARELAVMAGSHSSEAIHLETVAEILEKIGLGISALKCGTHVPFSRAVADEYRRRGKPFTPLEHNCSGKHAGMLAAAVAGGQDVESYLDPGHPVQQRILAVMGDLTGRMHDRIVVAVDGCGAPTLGVTLSEAARGFARLMAPESGQARHREAARGVVEAMRAHPEMVAGQGMLDTDLTALPRGSLISKRGAEGVQCAGFVRDGIGFGVAAKVADGDNGRARVALITGILRMLGQLAEEELVHLGETQTLVVRNNGGREVGAVRACFTLQSA